jgi:hypothetical protein
MHITAKICHQQYMHIVYVCALSRCSIYCENQTWNIRKTFGICTCSFVNYHNMPRHSLGGLPPAGVTAYLCSRREERGVLCPAYTSFKKWGEAGLSLQLRQVDWISDRRLLCYMYMSLNWVRRSFRLRGQRINAPLPVLLLHFATV